MSLMHISETCDATRSQSLDWPSRNSIYANVFLAQFISQIAHRTFQAGLGDGYHVVTRHDFFRGVVSHGHDRSAIAHERHSCTGYRDERINTYIERNPKTFAGRVCEITL